MVVYIYVPYNIYHYAISFSKCMYVFNLVNNVFSIQATLIYFGLSKSGECLPKRVPGILKFCKPGSTAYSMSQTPNVLNLSSMGSSWYRQTYRCMNKNNSAISTITTILSPHPLETHGFGNSWNNILSKTNLKFRSLQLQFLSVKVDIVHGQPVKTIGWHCANVLQTVMQEVKLEFLIALLRSLKIGSFLCEPVASLILHFDLSNFADIFCSQIAYPLHTTWKMISKRGALSTFTVFSLVLALYLGKETLSPPPAVFFFCAVFYLETHTNTLVRAALSVWLLWWGSQCCKQSWLFGRHCWESLDSSSVDCQA